MSFDAPVALFTAGSDLIQRNDQATLGTPTDLTVLCHMMVPAACVVCTTCFSLVGVEPEAS